MRILLLLLLAFAIRLPAAVTFSSIVAWDTSHSQVRINWLTSPATSSQTVMWDTSSHACGAYPAARTHIQNAANLYVANRAHAYYLSGLPPNTLIYYRVGGDGGSGEECSAEQTVTTASLPETHPVVPTLPATVDTTMPNYTTIVDVAPDCSDLLAKWNAAVDYTKIRIPANNSCRELGTIIFPSNAGKHIAIATADEGSLPAPGSRVSPAYASHMPTFVQNMWFHTGMPNYHQQTTPDGANCFFGSYQWFIGLGTPWKMKHCGEASVGNVTAVTGAGSTFTFTVNGHGLSPADTIHTANVGGFQRANGSGVVTAVPDANRVTALMSNGYYVWPDGPYTSGGTMTRGAWQDVPFTATTGKPTTACTAGAWAFDAANVVTDGYGSVTRGIWRCVSTNTWEAWRVAVAPESDYNNFPIWDFFSNAISNVRLIGIHFTRQTLPNEPLYYRWTISQFGGYPQAGLRTAPAMVTVGINNGVIFDRCLFDAPDQGGKSNFAVYSTGNNVAFLGSYIKMLGSMATTTAEDRGPDPDNYAAPCVLVSSGGPFLFDNNYIECYGLGVHVDDQGNFFRPAHDGTFKRNTFYRSDNYFYGSGTSDGRYYSMRQLLEFKGCNTCEVNGNVFDGNWANTAQGAGIMVFSPRQEYFHVTITGGVITATYPYPTKWPLSIPNVNDWVMIDDHGGNPGLYRVTATTATSITIANPPPDSTIYYFNVATGKGTRDITIRNNTFKRLPTGIYFAAHMWNSPAEGWAVRPFKVTNNVFHVIDESRTDPQNWRCNSLGASIFSTDEGVEDVLFEHNTIYRQKPYNIGGLCGNSLLTALRPGSGSAITNSLQGEGMFYRSNIVTQQGTGEAISFQGNVGKDAFDRVYSFYQEERNVWLREGGGITQAKLAITGTDYFPANLAAIQFNAADPEAANDWSIKATSPYHNVCDGGTTDCGVDMAGLLAAQSGGVGPNCSTLSFNPTGANVPASGASGSINVTVVDQTCAWTAISSQPYLTISNGIGTGNGTINWSMGANSSGARSATITSSNATFTASQAAANPGASTRLGGATVSGARIQ